MSDILTGTTVVNLDISIWTGKARLQRDEVDDSALPPEELATLGSKKLFDPDKLRRFYGVKSSAFAICNKYGVKFLGGWLVDDKYLPELVKKLGEYRTTWDELLNNFLASYQNDCQDWLAQNSQWANILANSMPRQSEIAKRFNFGWQTYNVVPAPTNVNGDQTQDELAIVPSRAIEKMAREVGAIVESFAPGKTFRAASLQRLASMCHTLSFSSPEVVKLGEILEKLASMQDVDIAHTMLVQLSDAAKLAELCVPNKSAGDILHSVVAPPPAPKPQRSSGGDQGGSGKPLPDVDGLLQEALSLLNPPMQSGPSSPAEVFAQPVPTPMPEPVPSESATPPKPQTDTQAALNGMLGMIDSEGLW